MKKRGSSFLAIVMLVSLLIGCGNQNTVAPTEETGSVAENPVGETEKQQPIEIDWDKVISETILEENADRYADAECDGEGHIILEQKEEQGVMTIYALTMYGRYQFQDGNFVKDAGSGVIPAVFSFFYHEDGSYKLKEYRKPEDGGGYGESIREMFPEYLWEVGLSPTEEHRRELKEQEQAYAADYLNKLGRETRIGDFGDFPHKLLTDTGISVEVSNCISANKDLGRYPFWLGNVEYLEDGRRYQYRMDLDGRSGHIVFTKTDMKNDTVIETYKFSQQTGELVQHTSEMSSGASEGSADILSCRNIM